MDLTVEGRIYARGEFRDCCIGISDGRITKIKKILKSENHIRFRNVIIIPAGIDIHVHFRDPGMTQKEDFKSGSLSAAFGGISCVFDMPNTNPQTVNVSSLEEKIDIARKKSYVDFGIYCGVNNNNIEKLQEFGKICDAYKIFLGESTNSFLLDEKNLPLVFKNTLHTKKPVMIHAEDGSCIRNHKIVEKNLIDHNNARPPECETSAVKSVLEFSKDIQPKIHFCHISTIDGLELIKKTSNNISCGVTPHHSLLSIDNFKNELKSQQFYKVNPPLRKSEYSDYLLRNIIDGCVDVIESDHAPHKIHEKNQFFGDAPSGVPGVETIFPLFLYLASQNKITFQRLISLFCSKPADIMNIKKGKIAEGYDADFIVVDYKKIKTIRSDELHSKCGWTPFEGWRGIFPSDVFIRGSSIIRDNELVSSPGFGVKV